MPTVPQLDFRIIGPRDFVGADVSVEGYVRTLNELITHSSFWRTINLEVTSSSAAAIVIAPIASLPMNGMRVIVAGGFTDTNTNFFQIRTAGSPETHVASNMYVGFTPSTSGSYTNFMSTQPFGTTGSLNRWSKYWSMGAVTNANAMFLIETQESILIHTVQPGVTSQYGALVGAIFLGYDSAGTESGRLFGMATTGNANPVSNFWAVTSAWLSNSTSANQNHMGGFEVLNGTGQNIWTIITRQSAISLTSQYPGETSTSNGTLTGLGSHVVRDAGNAALGFLRQIYAHQDRYSVAPGFIMSGSLNRSDSVPVGVFVSYGAMNALGDCALFISTGSTNQG